MSRELRLGRVLLLATGGVVGFLLLWEAVARSGFLPPALVPPPSAIPAAVMGALGNGIW